MKIKGTARIDTPERSKRIMKVASRKAKGRALQQYVAKKVQEAFDLPEEDVVSTSMGAGGVDVKLSARAREAFPYKIECKSQEGFRNIYNAYLQAESHSGPGTSLVIVKSNRKKPLAILDLDDFIELCQKIKK